jgi:hypothetical protein
VPTTRNREHAVDEPGDHRRVAVALDLARQVLQAHVEVSPACAKLVLVLIAPLERDLAPREFGFERPLGFVHRCPTA